MRQPGQQERGAPLAEIEMAYRLDYARFLRTATAIVGNERLAADAVHDGFVKAVRHRKTFKREGSIDAWVWRLVVNAARDLRTIEARREPISAESELLPTEIALPVDEGIAGLLRCLPDRQRTVLFLRYYADLEYSVIAEVLGIRVGTVSATLHAAHNALRSFVSKESAK
jgi:RNA polymerase sigma-70 factor, ECF subfamily